MAWSKPGPDKGKSRDNLFGDPSVPLFSRPPAPMPKPSRPPPRPAGSNPQLGPLFLSTSRPGNASATGRPGNTASAAQTGTNTASAVQTGTNNPTQAPSYVHQHLLDTTDSIIQKSLARQFNQTQRQVENERVLKARELDPSPSPTPSVSTDDQYDPNDDWHDDQIALNVILNARNEYSLMPETWKMSLKGIPMPEGLFYTKTKDIAVRPRIYAHTEKLEFQGVKVLRKLMDIHGRVTDLRDKQVRVSQNYNKTPTQRANDESNVIRDIARHLRKTLTRAVNWAAKDGALNVYGAALPSNIEIIDLTAEREQKDMRRVLTDRMNAMADRWDETLKKLGGFAADEKKPRAPVVFGLVIYKHILFIATMDAGDSNSVEHIPIQLNMGEKNQHQWNALAVMLTICWARDILRGKVQEMKLKPVNAEVQLSDPDA